MSNVTTAKPAAPKATKAAKATKPAAPKAAKPAVSKADWLYACSVVFGTTKGTGENRVPFESGLFEAAHDTIRAAYQDYKSNVGGYRAHQYGQEGSGDTLSVRAVYFASLGVSIRKSTAQIIRGQVNGK